MSAIKTGGPAFPSLNAEFTGIDSDGRERFSIEPSGGMTLRDYFAAKAMQGLVAGADPEHGINLSGVSEWAYNMADAMLKAKATGGAK